jgi:hypothetical protein
VVRVPGYRSRGPGFDSRCNQIFWEVMGLERAPLSLVSTNEELLGRNSSGSGLENREYGRVDPLRWPRDTLYPQKLALTSPTSGGHSVGIVLFRSKATEFSFVVVLLFTRWVQQPVASCRVSTNTNNTIRQHRTKQTNIIIVIINNNNNWIVHISVIALAKIIQV